MAPAPSPWLRPWSGYGSIELVCHMTSVFRYCCRAVEWGRSAVCSAVGTAAVASLGAGAISVPPVTFPEHVSTAGCRRSVPRVGY